MKFTNPMEEGAMHGLRPLHRPWLNDLMLGLSQVGEWQVLAGILVAGMALLLWMRRATTALILALCSGACVALVLGTKELVRRPRPKESWAVGATPGTWGFPSEHAAWSMMIFLLLALFLSRGKPARTRVAVVGSAVFLGLAIGFAWMYRGHSLLMDILMGWCAAVGVALIGFWAEAAFGPARPDASTGDGSQAVHLS
jgi:undecaprenyl-diphosphatase